MSTWGEYMEKHSQEEYDKQAEFMANTICQRSDKKWHYYDTSSFKWVGPYDTEEDAIEGFVVSTGVEKAA